MGNDAPAKGSRPSPEAAHGFVPLMKTLTISFLPGLRYDAPFEALDAALDAVPPAPIAEVPWEAYPYLPEVNVRMGYLADGLVLRYCVSEEVAQAHYRNTHDPVHKDSCAEFFVSFDQGAHYYNLEINCLGTRMMAYGKDVVPQRTKLPVPLVESIRVHTSVDESRPLVDQGEWELLVVVPLAVFIHEPNLDLAGKTLLGNFYKCGDDLPTPHYVAWNHVDFPTPSFHQPTSFGRLVFAAP